MDIFYASVLLSVWNPLVADTFPSQGTILEIFCRFLVLLLLTYYAFEQTVKGPVEWDI